MPVNTTHADYDWALRQWLRARDVLAGEDAVKAGGVRYLPRLEEMNDEEFAAYVQRASFFNATARTAEAYCGLVFRRAPFLKLPEATSRIGQALAAFAHDADLLGNSLTGYAREIVREVVAVGRAGSLVDWEGESENRVYVSRYAAENILNWRVERVRGRNLVTMVVLAEKAPSTSPQPSPQSGEGDEFAPDVVDQIRVLKLVDGEDQSLLTSAATGGLKYVVEIWQREDRSQGSGNRRRGRNVEWNLVDTRIPLRLGKPLPLIPFVFHGPRHSLPDVEKLPLGDVITTNLDHYRMDADYKHGMHFTALPTAWVSGFDKNSVLRIGSSTAWITDTIGATAGFLEYTGQGLKTFERALDRDERLMAVLGARLLESQKKVGETAEAIELRQSGENSILGNLALSVSASLTEVLCWAYWWNSTEASPADVTAEQVVMELNTDFSMKGMSAQELTSVVSAWQSGALSRDSMLDLFRRGEILPDGRTNKEETALIENEKKNAAGSGKENLEVRKTRSGTAGEDVGKQ